MKTRFYLKTLLAGLLMVVGLNASAATTLTVGAGPIELAPEQANQTVDLFLSSDSNQLIGGTRLRLVVESGGPSVTFGSLAGTVFDGGFVFPDTDGSALGLDVGPSALIPTPIDGTGQQRLGSLVFDTTGVASGTYTLNFTGTTLNDEQPSAFDFELTGEQSLTVVPEPTSLALLGPVVLALMRRRR